VAVTADRTSDFYGTGAVDYVPASTGRHDQRRARQLPQIVAIMMKNNIDSRRGSE
jgi:hypothetical protein